MVNVLQCAVLQSNGTPPHMVDSQQEGLIKLDIGLWSYNAPKKIKKNLIGSQNDVTILDYDP